ncbi:unnamed protein product [Caenorhabditis auriculariae]|uniref:Uncharacterized protein n=1 Tax=Caenorhabditis auriculariae TaxID=2777116 RepID=A0A8S1HK70_9PELO|nr:unnamed protein product [Caenorhabditis auriculariae]
MILSSWALLGLFLIFAVPTDGFYCEREKPSDRWSPLLGSMAGEAIIRMRDSSDLSIYEKFLLNFIGQQFGNAHSCMERLEENCEKVDQYLLGPCDPGFNRGNYSIPICWKKKSEKGTCSAVSFYSNDCEICSENKLSSKEQEKIGRKLLSRCSGTEKKKNRNS